MAIKYNLRTFQVQALEIATERFKEGKNAILAMPPGTDKGIVCVLFIKRILKEHSGYVILIVPSKALENPI